MTDFLSKVKYPRKWLARTSRFFFGPERAVNSHRKGFSLRSCSKVVISPCPGYTTILKTLQKMEKKGIVGHSSEGRKYLYFPKISKDKITGKRLGTIIDRVFSGNKLSFAEYFVNSNSFSSSELEELKGIISAKEKESK